MKARGARVGRRWGIALGLGLFLAPAFVRAGDAAAGEASADSAVRVEVVKSDAGLAVEGRCIVRAPAAVAWQVLTDYDGIGRFVTSMRESRVTERAENHLLVEQVAVSRLFLFSRRFRATLWVEEVPPDTIRFEDVLGRDFDGYRGEWRIEPRDGGLELVYQVTARPHTPVPDMFARGLFRHTARDLLAQVKAEIERRAAARGTASDGSPDAGNGSR